MKRIIVVLISILFLSGCNSNTVDYNKLVEEKLENAYTLYNAFYGVGLSKIFSEEPIIDKDDLYYLVNDEKLKNILNIKKLIDKTFEANLNEEYTSLISASDSIYKMMNNKLYSRYLGGCILEDFDKTKIKITKKTSKTIEIEYRGKKGTLYKKDKDYYFKENIIECDKDE